jgi:hypothetical protein
METPLSASPSCFSVDFNENTDSFIVDRRRRYKTFFFGADEELK